MSNEELYDYIKSKSNRINELERKMNKNNDANFKDGSAIHVKFGDFINEVLPLSNCVFYNPVASADLSNNILWDYYDYEKLKKYFLENRMIELYLNICESDKNLDVFGISFCFNVDVFKKMGNGLSIFDCINADVGDEAGYYQNCDDTFYYRRDIFTSLSFPDITQLYDIVVPIPLYSLTNINYKDEHEQFFKFNDFDIYAYPYHLYYDAAMNCIKNNKVLRKNI